MRFTVLFVVTLVHVGVVGCGSSTSDGNAARKTVLVDRETMAPFVLEVSESLPAVNPGTGKRTLMPGLYCPQCHKWYPVPPPDQINRQPDATLCPKTRAQLIPDGPFPEQTSDTDIKR